MNGPRILGVHLAAQTFDAAVDRLLAAARDGQRLRAHFCNVHTVMEAKSNALVREAFESADMLATDGVPLVWVARSRGFHAAERVSGPDVMLALCDRGRTDGLRHYFLGGRAGVPELLRDQLTARYPSLQVVGVESPPFRELDAEEDAALVARINNARPHVVWIGLGAPKQELWAADHASALEAPVLLPVGAAFDFHSGQVARATAWVRRIGMEWAFRILADPRRLWKRYAVTNTRFGIALLREEIGRRRSPRGQA